VQGRFGYISIADVLHDRENVAELKDKIILVAPTALGLQDMRNTPAWGGAFPIVEIHANLIAGLFDQNLKHQPKYMLGVEVLWLQLIGVALSFGLSLLSLLAVVFSAVMAFALSFWLNIALWQYSNIFMTIANILIILKKAVSPPPA
jgi:adenylate cyclase